MKASVKAPTPIPGLILGFLAGKENQQKKSRQRREAFLSSIDDGKINGRTKEYHPPLSIRKEMRALFTWIFYTP
jgi:hypothetical protein